MFVERYTFVLSIIRVWPLTVMHMDWVTHGDAAAWGASKAHSTGGEGQRQYARRETVSTFHLVF